MWLLYGLCIVLNPDSALNHERALKQAVRRPSNIMPRFEIRNLWTDDDSMLQPQITVSNDRLFATQDFYAYPEQLREFAEQLEAYSGKPEDIAVFEYGTDPGYYCHVLFRAVPVDSLGHSALELSFDNRKDPPESDSGHFFLACNPTTINELGRSLARWVDNTETTLEHHWTDA